MEYVAISLFFIYPIVGFSTMYILSKYKMKLAYVFYLIMFFTVFLYLPFYAVQVILGGINEQGSLLEAIELFDCFMWNPFDGIDYYINYAYIAVIGISAFLCLSTVFFAITAIEVVRHIRATRGFGKSIEFFKEKRPINRFLQKYTAHLKCKLCHSFCKYNC